MGILHRYVLRELLKTFALTATGLTLIFGMGGGLLNLIRIDQVSAADVARLLLYFVPVVAAFMLPVAAMLSCALVYGRLAADNELDACKASGINILRLLGSAVGLAVVVSAIALYLSNFTMPHLFQRINEVAQGDIQDLLVAKLRDQGHLPFNKNYTIYADDARKLTPDEAAPYIGGRDPRKQVVLIDKAAFVQYREDDPLQTGTAEAILLILDKSKSPVSITARMLKVRVYDHQRGRLMGAENPMLGLPQIPAIPTGGRMKLKFLDLSELFYFQDHPVEAPALQDKLARFRRETTGLALATQVLDSMTRRRQAVLKNPAGQEYRIRARRVRLDDQGRRPRLEMQEPVLEQIDEARHTRLYKAGKGEILFQTGGDNLTVGFVLRDNVLLQDPQESPRWAQQVSPYEAPALLLPAESIPATASYSDEQILDTSVALPMPEPLQKARKDLAGKMHELGREITAAIHARLTMSASTLVLVLLAAALGIVLRGGHALTAFGVAFIPTVIVVLVITTGRQLAEQEATSLVGLATMWGIIAAMAIVDAVIVLAGIRR